MASAASSPHAAGGADADTADSDSSAGVPGAALSEPVAAPTGRRLRSAARPLVLAAVACFAIGIGVAVHVAPDGAGPPALPRQVASDIDPETPPAVPRDAVADVVDQSLPEPAPEPAVAAAAPPAEPVAETLSEAPTGGQMMLPEEIETAAPAGDPPPDVAEILEPTAPATAVDAAPPTTAGAVAPERKRRIAARAPRRAPSDRVATAQSLLTQLGFSPGPIDGAEGPRTRRAIRAYQTRRGLAVTGAVDDRVLASLRRDAASQPPRPGSPSLLTSVIRTISATVGPRVDSVREPGSVVRYCRNNRDTWVYDFGKDRPVFCKYIDQPGG
ncbi:MAG: peptidoglycan-binding protein [Rhodospirillales bacterium]|nr:peptidoglycan-binding protein [Rhodospirillales bacterium]